MVSDRLSREQFYDALAELNEAGLKKALWTVYWRGSAPVRDRVMAAVDPSYGAAQASRLSREAAVDAGAVLAEVRQFAALARRGSYLAGDRSVSPKARTRWRFTFQRLVKDITQALAGRDVDPAAAAMATLIDLAGELKSFDYFRSDDPVEAARFVVSDAVAVMWAAMRREHGHAAFSEVAAAQLLRWEEPWGWTRRGDGWVSGKETSLAQVVAAMLPVADAWGPFADAYLRALDVVAQGNADGGREGGRARSTRLAEWHGMLRERLADGDSADRLDLLAHHPALTGRQ